MISPYSRFRMYWGIALVIGLIYTAIIMPYRIALISDDNIPMLVIDTIVEIVFFIDIYVSFNTPML